MYFIGLMSGTSMDAIDAVLVDIEDDSLKTVEYRQFPIAREIQASVRAINSQSTVLEITELDVVLGECFSNAVLEIIDLASLKPEAITAVGSHGQTILHLPGHAHPRTLQIGDPNIIACRTGITTVADFRRMDMAAGGQGAPLASAFHVWRFRDTNTNRIVLNLGGMANITILPANPDAGILGFDTGPGNALMDDWIRLHRHQEFDQDGLWAASGTCDTVLLKILLDDPYFSKPPPRSTGKDDFNLQWLNRKISYMTSAPDKKDVQATLLECTARSVSEAIVHYAADTREILLCGGGVHNLSLVKRLNDFLANYKIVSTMEYGVDPDAVEAITFAWLAKTRLDNNPANLPSVTGAAKKVILGGIYQP